MLHLLGWMFQNTFSIIAINICHGLDFTLHPGFLLLCTIFATCFCFLLFISFCSKSINALVWVSFCSPFLKMCPDIKFLLHMQIFNYEFAQNKFWGIFLEKCCLCPNGNFCMWLGRTLNKGKLPSLPNILACLHSVVLELHRAYHFVIVSVAALRSKQNEMVMILNTWCD